MLMIMTHSQSHTIRRRTTHTHTCGRSRALSFSTESSTCCLEHACCTTRALYNATRRDAVWRDHARRKLQAALARCMYMDMWQCGGAHRTCRCRCGGCRMHGRMSMRWARPAATVVGGRAEGGVVG